MSIFQRTGQLRHPLEIQEKVSVPDGQGGFTDEWQTVKKVWGKVSPVSSDRRNEYMKTETEISHEIEARGLLDIDTNKNRILFKGSRVFEPVEIADIEERQRKLEIVALEIEGDTR